MNVYSPLRYPGGKGKLAPYLAEIITLNNLEGGHYAEPFAGGAAVALELLFCERVSHIHINDIDPSIFAFWYSVVHNTNAFLDRVVETHITIDSWMEAKEIRRNPAAYSMLDLGFATFFLSRTNRSGILNGGMIGGHSQSGEWKIDCRFNKEELISRVRRIGFFRSRISVCNLDAVKFLKTYATKIPGKCFLYIDPPYYVKGAYLYQNHFLHDDHVRLAKIVSNVKRHKWIVSYDNVEQIRNIYSSNEQEQFDINYSARSYARGSEVMVFSNGLVKPTRIYCSEKERKILQGSLVA
jgi:DNA adenine methylase